MINIKSVLESKMASSNGKARVVEVPAKMKPTTESLKKLHGEIKSQRISNENMRYKSYHQKG